MDVTDNIMKDKIVEILMKKNPTKEEALVKEACQRGYWEAKEEALVKEAYQRGYWEGTYNIASKHNYMLNRALHAAERVRYKKMLKGFLAQYFDFLNSQQYL